MCIRDRHATAERSLGKLGGLIRYMPWVAWVTLVGVLTSAGLPPLGGFVSEWLLLQSFLFTPGLPDSLLNMLIPVSYTHLRAHETVLDLVCRLLLEKKK